MSPSPELAAALDAAEAAARVIRELYAKNLAVRLKADKSPVTEADVRAEEAIRGVLAARFPGHAFYGDADNRLPFLTFHGTRGKIQVGCPHDLRDAGNRESFKL